MPDMFKEILPSILQTKKSVFEINDDYKSYVPFIINKALAAHKDCVLYVNRMNMKPFLAPKIQYEYYINSIRPGKREYQEWLKKEKYENLELIKEYFGISFEKAKQYEYLLKDEDIEKIRKSLDKGGNRSE